MALEIVLRREQAHALLRGGGFGRQATWSASELWAYVGMNCGHFFIFFIFYIQSEWAQDTVFVQRKGICEVWKYLYDIL